MMLVLVQSVPCVLEVNLNKKIIYAIMVLVCIMLVSSEELTYDINEIKGKIQVEYTYKNITADVWYNNQSDYEGKWNLQLQEIKSSLDLDVLEMGESIGTCDHTELEARIAYLESLLNVTNVMK